MRKRTEQQIARAKERLDLALTSSSLALWDWDLRQNRVYFNENWAQLLGSPSRESTFSGDEVLSWSHDEDREVLRAAVGNAAKGVSEEFDCEYRVPNATGEWIWVHSRGKVTMRDPAGHALRMSPISSRKSVPPSACSKRPRRMTAKQKLSSCWRVRTDLVPSDRKSVV